MSKSNLSKSYKELEREAEQVYKDDKLVSAILIYKKMIKKAFCQKQIDYCESMISFIRHEIDIKANESLNIVIKEIMNETDNIECKD